MNKLMRVAQTGGTIHMAGLTEEEAVCIRGVAAKSEKPIHKALAEWMDMSIFGEKERLCGLKLRDIARSQKCNAVTLMMKSAEKEASRYAKGERRV